MLTKAASCCFRCRTPDKKFPQRRPTSGSGWQWNLDKIRRVLYRLPQLIEAVANEHVVFIVEGEKDADRLASLNIPATCNPGGASEDGKKPKWRDEYNEHLRGADIVIVPDNDAPGRAHAQAIAQSLSGIAARIRLFDLAKYWPDCPEHGDISDWLNAGNSVEQLWEIVGSLPDWAEQTKASETPQQPPCTIMETLAVYEKWLILPDKTPVYAVLGTVAANLLPGAPVWLGVIGPPSSAKTELLNSVSGLPHVVQAATLSIAGLLSGTSKKQYDKGAKGGLLRQLGDFGIIALKDFGSILSLRPDAKAEILAALREIYDGAWTRHLGTDGGRTLSWSGKVALLFAATGVIDAHYGVIGAMGDRFLLSRLAPVEHGQFVRALQHVGAATTQMRKELAEAVARLFAGRKTEPQPISPEEIHRIDRIIMLVVRLRGAVERDRYSRDVEAVYGAEGTARIGLTLERLLAGLDTLGVDRATALNVVEAIAMDSVPPIRRRAYEYLQTVEDGFAETTAVANAVDLSTTTTRRALEDLAAYRLIERVSQGAGKPDIWRVKDPVPSGEQPFPQYTYGFEKRREQPGRSVV